MRKLAKYTKPYLLMLIVSIALLFAQANLDLALPDYLSRIVNTGIQQGGVENAVPVAIRQSEMERVRYLYRRGRKNLVLADYTLVDRNSPDYEKYVEEYPALSNESIYLLKDVGQAEIDRLNPLMGKALLTVSGIEQVVADPSKAAQMGGAFGQGFDLSKLPPGVDVFTMLGQLPSEQLSKIKEGTNSQFEALGDSMIVQAATSAVKAEYKALGMDTGKLQNSYVINLGVWMLGITLLSALCTIIVGFLSARIAAGMARDVRRDTFKKVESFSSTEFENFSTASLITRTTNDITQIQMVIMIMVRMVFYAPLIGVGGVIKVLSKDSPLAWLIVVACVDVGQFDHHRCFDCHAKIQDHPETDRSGQSGRAREPLRHDGHPRLQYADL